MLILSVSPHGIQREDFPSLGIGHFIWYRADQQSTFEETFPQLIEFMNTKRSRARLVK